MRHIAIWSITICLLVGFFLALAGTRFIRRLALKRNFVDSPGGHKGHAHPIALGGGIAITFSIVAPVVAGFAVLMFLCHDGVVPHWFPQELRVHVPGLLSRSRPALAIMGGALLIHSLGIVDDSRALGPWIKLTGQIIVAAMLAVGFEIRLLTQLGAPLSIAVTVLWIVLITNAFNFLDNMDGLCAGVGVITALIFATTALRIGQIFVPALTFLIIGVLLGFLCFNFPPARIFMGDSGSLVVGYLLAVLTILTTFWDQARQSQPVGLLVPFLVLAVPLYDTTSVVILRLRRGISPLRGDQRHFSHRLVQRGMSQRRAVLTIYLATAATGLGATILGESWTDAFLAVGQCCCVVLIIAILEQVGTGISRE